MAEVGTAADGTAAGAVVVGAGAVSALASEPACFSLLLLALLITAATATTHTTMVTPLLTAMALMAMGTVAPTMAMAAITRAIGPQVITPIVVITIGMGATIRIAGTPTVENRAAFAHHRKTAVKAVFLFCPLVRLRAAGKKHGAKSHGFCPSGQAKKPGRGSAFRC